MDSGCCDFVASPIPDGTPASSRRSSSAARSAGRYTPACGVPPGSAPGPGDPQQVTGRRGQELKVPAESACFAGVPRVVAVLSYPGEAVAGDEGAVQHDVAHALAVAAVQERVQARCRNRRPRSRTPSSRPYRPSVPVARGSEPYPGAGPLCSPEVAAAAEHRATTRRFGAGRRDVPGPRITHAPKEGCPQWE